MKGSTLFVATACAAALSCHDADLSSPGIASVSTDADVVVPGVWTNVATPNVTRFTSGVAAGPDGRIYAAGGQIAVSPGVTATAEVYDPATNVWTLIAPLPLSRILQAAALGGDGRVYQIGGAVGGVISNSVIVYNPATNTWSAAAPMPGPGRQLPGATTGLDGRIYVAGGRVLGGTGFVASTFAAVYDPTTNVWTSIAPLPVATYAPAMATGPNGLIYLIGGTSLTAPLFPNFNAVYAYDPATNVWTAVASLPAPRVFAAAARGVDGNIYAFGGRNGSTTLPDVQAYDVVANTWTTVPSMNLPRVGLGGAVGSDGRIYAVGGGAVFSAAVNLPAEAYGPIPNLPPNANAGADVTAECAGGGADVVLNGSSSTDDHVIASYEWFEGASSIATGVNPTVHLGVGTHTIVLRVTDGDGLFDDDTVVVTVADTQAPTVSLTLLTNKLWPPNHEMVKVASGISASDGCDGSPTLSVTVSSNEPINGLGDGDTSPDWDVVANGDGTFDVYVRAERSGKGSGRVYTIKATATDGSGNTTTQTATVSVPKSQGKS